jgi:hypothetical protein
MTPDHATVVLFDVDGVLIEPGGYRYAMRDAMRHFLQHLGQPHWQPDASFVEQFESHMLTSEWDMLPLTLCHFLDHALQFVQPTQPWQTLADAAADIAQHPAMPVPTQLFAVIDQIGAIVNGRSGNPSLWIYESRTQADFPFQRLRTHAVLTSLLAHTRDIQRSETMRIFQQHIIGSENFRTYYHTEPELDLPNYLTLYDTVPMKAEVFQALQKKIDSHELFVSIYTARPSMPPAGISPNGDGAYSPEAEQAAALLPWRGVYLSAYGKVYWLAQQTSFHPEELLKPSPAQALSAIAYHFTGNEAHALQWAADVLQTANDNTLTSTYAKRISLPADLTLHVFEDSPNGFSGGIQAAGLLRAMGIEVDLHLWGISANPVKQTALRAQGGQVFSDVNQAVQQALFAALV